jgi:hypothetical protein
MKYKYCESNRRQRHCARIRIDQLHIGRRTISRRHKNAVFIVVEIAVGEIEISSAIIANACIVMTGSGSRP